LGLVLNLFPDTLKYTDGGSIVVHAAGGAESGLNHSGRGDKIMCEAVVKAALNLEEVTGVLEELDIAFREGLE
jgi:hypothetical protein